MHEISGMLDGSLPQPTRHSFPYQGLSYLNPTYSYWLRIDQLIHAWLFATIFKDNLNKVRDLQHSFQVWQCLESRFNTTGLAYALDLK